MPNPIEENPELARAVGILAGRWGQVEFAVEVLFQLVSGMTDRKAILLFSFFKSVTTQCDVINLLSRETDFLLPETISSIKSVLKLYKNLSDDRNRIIHYPFGFDTLSAQTANAPIYKMVRQRSGDDLYIKRIITPEDVIKIADLVQSLLETIWKTHEDMRRDLYSLPEAQRSQSPDQIRALLIALREYNRSRREESPRPSESFPG